MVSLTLTIFCICPHMAVKLAKMILYLNHNCVKGLGQSGSRVYGLYMTCRTIVPRARCVIMVSNVYIPGVAAGPG